MSIEVYNLIIHFYWKILPLVIQRKAKFKLFCFPPPPSFRSFRFFYEFMYDESCVFVLDCKKKRKQKPELHSFFNRFIWAISIWHSFYLKKKTYLLLNQFLLFFFFFLINDIFFIRFSYDFLMILPLFFLLNFYFPSFAAHLL